jgi:GTPase-associated protein 1, N-terminal domain type 2
VALEQLLYTWAERGLDGRGRLQPIAASPALLEGGGGPRPLVLRLCLYDRGPGSRGLAEEPVSYGWADSGPFRYAFTRRYLGADPMGRPGNFAAHVLVGPREEMPTRRLLELFGSPSWWAGDVDGSKDVAGRLAPVSLADFAPGVAPTGSQEDAATVLAAILARGERRLVTIREPNSFIGSLLVATEVLGDLLEGTSFSTYERGDAAKWFNIVGATNQAPGGSKTLTVESVVGNPALAAERAAATLVVDPDQKTRATVRHAWMAAHAVTPPDVGRFIRVCAANATARKGADCSVAEMLPAFAAPDTANDLLDYTDIRRCVAEAIVAGETRVMRGVASCAVGLDQDILIALGTDIAERADFQPSRLAQLTAWVQQLPVSLGDSLADGTLNRFRAREWPEGNWPAEFTAMVTKRASAASATREVLEVLIDQGSRHVLVLANDGRLRPDWWAQMLRRALEVGLVTHRAAGLRLLDEPGLIQAVIATLSTSDMALLLGTLSAEEAADILGNVHYVEHPEEFVRLLEPTVLRLPGPARCFALEPIRQLLGRQTPDNWSPLVIDALTTRMFHDLRQPRARHVVEQLQLLCKGSTNADLALWDGLLRPLSSPIRPGRAGEALRHLPQEHLVVAARYALDVYVSTAARPNVGNAVAALTGGLQLEHHEVARTVLLAGLRGVLAEQNAGAGVSALAFVAHDLVEQKLLSRRILGGRVTDGETQALGEELIAALAVNGTMGMRALQEMSDLGPRGKAWLASLGFKA